MAISNSGINPVRAIRCKAFTVMELLIAIAIIAVLISITFVGIGKMQAISRGKLTSQLLSNCQALLREYDRATQMKGIPTAAIAAPGSVSDNAPDRNGTAVQKTREMTALIRGLPINDTAIKQLPPSQVWTGATLAEGPVFLDGWSSPIIFVPANGLSGVDLGSGPTTIVSPDGKPFFASAGPDRSFSSGKDNLYSFQY